MAFLVVFCTSSITRTSGNCSKSKLSAKSSRSTGQHSRNKPKRVEISSHYASLAPHSQRISWPCRRTSRSGSFGVRYIVNFTTEFPNMAESTLHISFYISKDIVNGSSDGKIVSGDGKSEC